MPKTMILDCIAEKIDFNKIHSQDDLNKAIIQAADVCVKEHPVECDCGKDGKKKREPSAYNLFIKDCFKNKSDPTLKNCAGEWRESHPKK